MPGIFGDWSLLLTWIYPAGVGKGSVINILLINIMKLCMFSHAGDSGGSRRQQ